MGSSQVVFYDAPDVVVWAKEDSDKLDPTAKLVLYGGVADTSSAHDFLWSQVMRSVRLCILLLTSIGLISGLIFCGYSLFT